MTPGELLFIVSRRPQQRGDWTLVSTTDRAHFERVAQELMTRLARTALQLGAESLEGHAAFMHDRPDCPVQPSTVTKACAEHLREVEVDMDFLASLVERT